MRQIRDILRLKWTLQRSHRQTARSVGVSAGRRTGVVSRATHRGFTWEAVTALTDDQLEAALWGPKLPLTAARSVPDPLHIHTELRGKGVTLELLHLEYLADHPDGLRYSAFCAHYRRWVALQRCSMRQVHKAGEKLFVDYAGQRPHLVDPRTGEVVPVELFIAVLGASNYTYAEATLSRRVPDFLASHTRAVEFFGGVTTIGRARSTPQRRQSIRVGTNRAFSEAMPTGRGTTRRRLCPRGRRNHETRRRPKWPYRSRSGGSSRGSATRPSSPWRRSTSASPNSSRT